MIQRLWSITLTVPDLQKAVDFYENVLGLEKKYQFEDYAGFDLGGVELGLKTWGAGERPRKGEPCLDLLVKDIEKAYQVLKGKGVDFEKPPYYAIWGAKIAPFKDPFGHWLQLTQIIWPRYLENCSPKQVKNIS